MSPKSFAFCMLVASLLLSNAAFAQTGQDKDEGRVLTKPTPQIIRVITPNGGENFEEGTSVEIEWELITKDASDSIQIRLKEGLGDAPTRILASLAKLSSSSWTWKNAGPASTDLRVEIAVYNGNQRGITDTSDKSFSIVSPKLTVLSPNGGEILGETTTAVIEWSNPFLDGYPVPEGNFRILISRDGGRNYSALIADRIAITETSYNWVVEAPPSIEARIKVLFMPTTPLPSIIEDNSDGDFRIVAGIRKAKTELHD